MRTRFDRGRSRHDELVREREEASAQEMAQLERGVFALSYPRSVATERDRDAYRQSYRDAAFRVFNMEPENLERVLDRAERIGDAQLAQAVYHEAVERGLSAIAKRYRAEHPDAQQRWEKYVAARQADEGFGGLLTSATLSVGPERQVELIGGPR